jgi:hypothetical protein
VTRAAEATNAAAAATTAAMATAAVATTAAAASAARTAAARNAAPPPVVVYGGAPAVGTIVASLPPGCVQTMLNGVEYQRCGSTYYRATFSGPNLVFVVQQP